MRKILMMAVLAFLSLQGVGARASGISLLESGKKKLVAQEDTVKKVQSPNQKIPDRKTKCVIKTHINIKQNVIFSAKLKPV